MGLRSVSGREVRTFLELTALRVLEFAPFFGRIVPGEGFLCNPAWSFAESRVSGGAILYVMPKRGTTYKIILRLLLEPGFRKWLESDLRIRYV